MKLDIPVVLVSVNACIITSLLTFLLVGSCETTWRSGESEQVTESEVITSPFYPDPYPANVFCRYTLIAQRHERVQIVFTDFDLSYPHGNPNDPYRYDSVESWKLLFILLTATTLVSSIVLYSMHFQRGSSNLGYFARNCDS